MLLHYRRQAHHPSHLTSKPVNFGENSCILTLNPAYFDEFESPPAELLGSGTVAQSGGPTPAPHPHDAKKEIQSKSAYFNRNAHEIELSTLITRS